MDKKYVGLCDDGKWEPFSASEEAEATPEVTGYKRVICEDNGKELF